MAPAIVDAARKIVDGGVGTYGMTFSVRDSSLVSERMVQVGGPEGAAGLLFGASAPHLAVADYRGAVATVRSTLGARGERILDVSGLRRVLGMEDSLRVSAIDPEGFGVLVAAPHRVVLTPTRSDVRRLGQLAAHLHTGMRARRRRGEADEAVVAPDGRVLHAEAKARATEARAALSAAARSIDGAKSRRGAADADEALEAWRAMVAGRWTLVDRFESDGRRFLVARPNAPRPAALDGLTNAETTCALYASMGHSGKLIAYELGISESTVSTHLRSAMRKLGLRSRAQLASALGVQAARQVSG